MDGGELMPNVQVVKNENSSGKRLVQLICVDSLGICGNRDELLVRQQLHLKFVGKTYLFIMQWIFIGTIQYALE